MEDTFVLNGEKIHRHARWPRKSAFAPDGTDPGRLLQRSGAPRPAHSRMTIAGSRSPGSRVTASNHLPRIKRSQWHQMVVGSPLTVAGAAAALLVQQRTAFP